MPEMDGRTTFTEIRKFNDITHLPQNPLKELLNNAFRNTLTIKHFG